MELLLEIMIKTWVGSFVLIRTAAILMEVFHDFPQSLCVDARMPPSVGPLLLLS